MLECNTEVALETQQLSDFVKYIVIKNRMNLLMHSLLFGLCDVLKVLKIARKSKNALAFIRFPQFTYALINIYLALINRAGGLYGRILTEVVSTDRTQ